jgi:hypothetical protein
VTVHLPAHGKDDSEREVLPGFACRKIGPGSWLNKVLGQTPDSPLPGQDKASTQVTKAKHEVCKQGSV